MKLNRYTYSPKITDQEYDAAYRELETIEKLHPEWVQPTSPTKKVGGEVIDEFKKNRTYYTYVIFRRCL